MPFENGHMLI